MATKLGTSVCRSCHSLFLVAVQRAIDLRPCVRSIRRVLTSISSAMAIALVCHHLSVSIIAEAVQKSQIIYVSGLVLTDTVVPVISSLAAGNVEPALRTALHKTMPDGVLPWIITNDSGVCRPKPGTSMSITIRCVRQIRATLRGGNHFLDTDIFPMWNPFPSHVSLVTQRAWPSRAIHAQRIP